MNLQEWLSHCERLHPQNIDMGLERVAAVAKKMGFGKADIDRHLKGG